MKREFVINRNGKDYVLYAGLLDQAHQQGLKEIKTQLLQAPSSENGQIAICLAEVTTERGTFTGIGDADPGNVSRMMVTALIRMAETRAKARALRDAVNVGVTALEELGDDEARPETRPETRLPESQKEPQKAGASAARPAPAPAAPPRSATAPAEEDEGFEGEGEPEPERFPGRPARTNGRQDGLRLGFGVGTQESRGGAGVAAPATPKQLQTIARMARAAGKSIETEGLSRAQASEIISGLIGEMGQLRAS
jgi:hypothetical protein